MKRMSLYFCCFLHFLGMRCIAKGSGGNLKFSAVVPAEQKSRAAQLVPGADRPWAGDREFMKKLPLSRLYHAFPMFQDVQVPLAEMEQFRPVPERRRFPKLLTSLLLPQTNPLLGKVSPARNARGVEVWCGHNKVSLRVNRNLLGFSSSPSSFQLGTCPVSRSDKNFFYFHYNLRDCNSSLTIMNDQIMYSNMLRYTPEAQGPVIRAVPLTLGIQCLYNRFHYSYKMGYLPVARESLFHKSLKSRVKFSTTLYNERWERLEGNGSFVLGEPMYFEVSAAPASNDNRIFVDSCYASASSNPKSTPQHNIISNYGCLEDSRRQGSLSRFVVRQPDLIRFSVEAFLLPEVTDTYFYLHCTVSVHNATTSSSAKSCTYNNAMRRWEELHTDASVCACCDSTCEPEDVSESLPRVLKSLITSRPWVLEKSEKSIIKTMKGLVHILDDDTSADGIDEEEDDVEIVIDAEEQIEVKEKSRTIPMEDLDEDVEVIIGMEETTATDLKEDEEGDRYGKMFDLEQMDGVVETEKEDDDYSGRFKSRNQTNIDKNMLNEELDDDIQSSDIGQNQTISISREDLSKDDVQPEGFKRITVQRTIPSHMLMGEEIFLNAREEPVEWIDEH